MALEDVGKNLPATQPAPAPRRPLVPLDWQSTNPTTRIMEMVLRCELPEDPKDYLGFFEVLATVAGTNPNCTHATIKKWTRTMIDIDDRAFSEGRTHIMMAKARKLLFEMRAYMSRGDNPHQGLTGVSSIITVRQQSEHTEKTPQQPAPTGLMGLLPRRRREE